VFLRKVEGIIKSPERAISSNWFYRAFYRFGQTKFIDVGSVLGSSQFSILPQLPLKMMLGLKVVKINSKISNWLCSSKSVTLSVP
jgi:hypothetical protein